MEVPSGIVHQAEIAKRVAAVEEELAPDVVRIRYNVGPDWTGDWSIFFRIVLSDKASRSRKLVTTARRRLSEEVEAANLGFFPFFNFRTESEQKVLKEKEWE